MSPAVWLAIVAIVGGLTVTRHLDPIIAFIFVVLVVSFFGWRDDLRHRRAEQARALDEIPTPDPGPVEQAAADPSETAWYYGHHGGLYYAAEGRIMNAMRERWATPEQVAERHDMSPARARLLLARLTERGALVADAGRYRVATPQERKAHKAETGIQP